MLPTSLRQQQQQSQQQVRVMYTMFDCPILVFFSCHILEEKKESKPVHSDVRSQKNKKEKENE